MIRVAADDIVKINQNLTDAEYDSTRTSKVNGCYSSYSYYGTVQEQIASITMSLARGHFFVDGNKRTALVTFLILCSLNKLECHYSNKELVELFVNIAAATYKNDVLTKMLFTSQSHCDE